MSDVKTVAYLPGTVIDNKSWAHPDGAYQIPVVLRSDLEASEARAERLEAVLLRLTTKLLDIQADPQFIGVWAFLKVHGNEYRGPNWDEELAAARVVSKE